MGKCNSLSRAIARTKAAMEEDRMIAQLNDLLGVQLRRRLGAFVGLPGYHVEVVNGSMDMVAEAWRIARERAEAIETPVVLYRVPGKEYRVLMSVSEFVDVPVSDSLDYTMNMSIITFALLWQKAQARQMHALMGTKRFVIEYGVQMQ